MSTVWVERVEGSGWVLGAGHGGITCVLYNFLVVCFFLQYIIGF